VQSVAVQVPGGGGAALPPGHVLLRRLFAGINASDVNYTSGRCVARVGVCVCVGWDVPSCCACSQYRRVTSPRRCRDPTCALLLLLLLLLLPVCLSACLQVPRQRCGRVGCAAV
jgi:hypothetical protein